MSMKLYVGNLSYQTTEDELVDLFTQYGTVESAKIITDRYSGESKGFGFVEMSNREEGESAIEQLNGKPFSNRTITVNEARPQDTNRRGSGFSGGGGGGGGRRSSNRGNRY